jgi:hypothetical protein
MATFRVLAKDDRNADAALASEVGYPPALRSLTPSWRPLSDQRGRRPAAAEIVRKAQSPNPGVLSPMLLLLPQKRQSRAGADGSC